jgi:membrane protein
MQKTAILFDIDGTLVDSNEHHVTAWQRAFAEAGHQFDRATLHAQLGKGGDNYIPSLLPESTEEEQAALGEAHGRIYRDEYLPQVKPFSGARDLLERAKDAGKTVVLASSASREELDRCVTLLDAADLLDATTSADDVRHSKPCPDIFEAALRSSGCAAPAEALVIGDTPFDIIAARGAGMEAVAVRSGRFSDEALEAERPVAIYDDVAAILAGFDRSPLAT